MNPNPSLETTTPATLRESLVSIALEWERRYGVSPQITSALSEYDAAILVGQTPTSFGEQNQTRTAVTKGYDFIHNGLRYQIKANRPSGKPGSFVTLVAKATNYEWDRLIWILYDREYNLQEAWQWDVEKYEQTFDAKKRISPKDMRGGIQIFPILE